MIKGSFGEFDTTYLNMRIEGYNFIAFYKPSDKGGKTYELYLWDNVNRISKADHKNNKAIIVGVDDYVY
jgi:hypothetical protein